MKITFKDGIIVEIIETENKSKKELIAQAKEIHDDFVKDAKLRRTFYTNTTFSATEIKEAIAEGDWRKLDKELKLLDRDIDTDIRRNTNYTEKYSKDQLKKVIKAYEDVVVQLRRLEDNETYLNKADEINTKINQLKENWSINDSVKTNDVPPYYDPSVTIGETGNRYSSSRIEKANRYNDLTVLEAEFDGVIDDLEEYIQDTTDYDDPNNVLHTYRKDELRQITAKYYELANIYRKNGLVDQADNIKALTDTLYQRWHLGA